MNIIIEGPEKAGKTTLIDLVLRGFKPERTQRIHIHHRESEEPGSLGDGFGYLYRFVSGLDSPEIVTWDRGWISENVYGNLLEDGRHLAKDPFKSEWFYGRALQGRGGKFVLLPDDRRILASLRDSSDIPVDPIEEFTAFERFADYWGYDVLYNNYDFKTLVDNMLEVRKSPFVGIHQSRSSQYIGSKNPVLTFVGDSTPQFNFAPQPFYCENSMEYFRVFGRMATRNFGYATIEAVDEMRAKEPHLFKTVVTLGPRAFHAFPEYPNAHYNETTHTKNDIVGFTEGVKWALKEYRINGKLDDGAMKWPKPEHREFPWLGVIENWTEKWSLKD